MALPPLELFGFQTWQIPRADVRFKRQAHPGHGPLPAGCLSHTCSPGPQLLSPRMGDQQPGRAGQPEFQPDGQEGSQVPPGAQGTRSSAPLGRPPWKGTIPAGILCLPAPAPSDICCALTTRPSYMRSHKLVEKAARSRQDFKKEQILTIKCYHCYRAKRTNLLS